MRARILIMQKIFFFPLKWVTSLKYNAKYAELKYIWISIRCLKVYLIVCFIFQLPTQLPKHKYKQWLNYKQKYLFQITFATGAKIYKNDRKQVDQYRIYVSLLSLVMDLA